MIVLHAAFPIDPTQREKALDLISDLVEHSRAEDGIVEYHATTDLAEENTVRFFERYEDEAAFEAHTQTDHFAEFEAALPELLAGEPEAYRFEVDSVSQPEL